MSIAEIVTGQSRQIEGQRPITEGQQSLRKGVFERMMGWRSPVRKVGWSLNQLLKKFISAFHSSPPEERHNLMKKQIKKFQDFELKDIHYMQVLSHWIMPKVYYLQQKLREVKGISLSKYNKQKHLLLEKIKNGLRTYQHLKLFYEVAVFAKQDYPSQKFTPSQEDEHSKPKDSSQELRKPKETALENTQLKRLKKGKERSSSSSSSSSDSSQTEVVSERQRSRYKKMSGLKRNKGSRIVRKMK